LRAENTSASLLSCRDPSALSSSIFMGGRRKQNGDEKALSKKQALPKASQKGQRLP
jgi:hypothetical protein